MGASNDREKFGNKVLRCYIEHGYRVVPINTRTKQIEGLTCETSLSSLVQKCNSKMYGDDIQDASQIGVSIITPPGLFEST